MRTPSGSTLVVNAQLAEQATFGDIFSTPSLVQKLLPVYDFRARFAVDVCAPGHRVYRIARDFDLASIVQARAFLRLRGIRSGVVTFSDLGAIGLRPLAEQPDSEFVLGAAGTLWWPTAAFKPLTAEEFPEPSHDGTIKAAFTVRVVGGNRSLARLSTEVRVHCHGTAARRRCSAFWFLARPVLTLILREMLWDMKRAAESG
jgi:hypothetical protein